MMTQLEGGRHSVRSGWCVGDVNDDTLGKGEGRTNGSEAMVVDDFEVREVQTMADEIRVAQAR